MSAEHLARPQHLSQAKNSHDAPTDAVGLPAQN